MPRWLIGLMVSMWTRACTVSKCSFYELVDDSLSSYSEQKSSSGVGLRSGLRFVDDISLMCRTTLIIAPWNHGGRCLCSD